MKTCSKCKEDKSLDEFGEDKKRKDGKNVYCKACCREQYSSFYSRNKDKKKKYRESRKEQKSKYDREYAKLNRSSRTKRETITNKKRRETDEIYRVTINYRRRVTSAFASLGYEKEVKTETLLGCTFRELVENIGARPDRQYHLDHIAPLSWAKSKEEVKQLSNYRNLRWIPAQDNLKKGNKETVEGVLLYLELTGKLNVEVPYGFS